jgi:hypothetical protein
VGWLWRVVVLILVCVSQAAHAEISALKEEVKSQASKAAKPSALAIASLVLDSLWAPVESMYECMWCCHRCGCRSRLLLLPTRIVT